MPLHAVRRDLEEGRLKALSIGDTQRADVAMSAVWQTKSPPGPAGRWFIERLKEIPLSNSVSQAAHPQAKKHRARC
jgi:DNA-binding transcriptional LysR family regulator